MKWHVLFLAVLAGCPAKTREPPPTSRYEAVKAAAEHPSHWCDTTGPGPRLTLPPLAPPPAGRAQPALVKGRRTWLNVWATWCQPCLREIPLLLKWQGDLHKDGVDVDVLLLSLDDDAPTLDQFLAQRKDLHTAKLGRIASQSDYEQWVNGFVEDPSVPIPIHLLGSSEGRLACVRNGSLREGDYPAARAALR